MGNDTFEVNPIHHKKNSTIFQNLFLDNVNNYKHSSTPHIVKRAVLNTGEFVEDYFSLSRDVFKDKFRQAFLSKEKENVDDSQRSSLKRLTLEVALFFDEAAYKRFSPFMNYDDMKLQDMILAYLNGVSKRLK